MPVANPKPSLRPRFACIDELAKQLPPAADHGLRHFLQRKSCENAAVAWGSWQGKCPRQLRPLSLDYLP
jgi:hypothetical protein